MLDMGKQKVEILLALFTKEFFSEIQSFPISIPISITNLLNSMLLKEALAILTRHRHSDFTTLVVPNHRNLLDRARFKLSNQIHFCMKMKTHLSVRIDPLKLLGATIRVDSINNRASNLSPCSQMERLLIIHGQLLRGPRIVHPT